MLRLDASWLASFLAVACAALWVLARVDDPRRAGLIAEMGPPRSPMDMPLWYRPPWQQGEDFEIVRAIPMEELLKESRAIAVRGYW